MNKQNLASIIGRYAGCRAYWSDKRDIDYLIVGNVSDAVILSNSRGDQYPAQPSLFGDEPKHVRPLLRHISQINPKELAEYMDSELEVIFSSNYFKSVTTGDLTGLPAKVVDWFREKGFDCDSLLDMKDDDGNPVAIRMICNEQTNQL